MYTGVQIDRVVPVLFWSFLLIIKFYCSSWYWSIDSGGVFKVSLMGFQGGNVILRLNNYFYQTYFRLTATSEWWGKRVFKQKTSFTSLVNKTITISVPSIINQLTPILTLFFYHRVFILQMCKNCQKQFKREKSLTLSSSCEKLQLELSIFLLHIGLTVFLLFLTFLLLYSHIFRWIRCHKSAMPQDEVPLNRFYSRTILSRFIFVHQLAPGKNCY